MGWRGGGATNEAERGQKKGRRGKGNDRLYQGMLGVKSARRRGRQNKTSTDKGEARRRGCARRRRSGEAENTWPVESEN